MPQSPEWFEVAVPLQKHAGMTTLETRRTVALLFAVLLLAAGSGGAAPTESRRTEEPPRGVVLSGRLAVDLGLTFCLLNQDPHPETFTAWQPSPADIAHLEARLPEFLHRAKPRRALRPLHEYYRQYGGVIKNGRKTICVSFLHESSGESLESLKSDIMIHADGGAYYFQAQFDLESDSFDQESFNGEV